MRLPARIVHPSTTLSRDRSIPLVSRALRSTVAVPESTEEVSDSEIDRIVEAAESAGATAIAVWLLDSYRDRTAEQKVRAALVAKTTIPVSISSDVVAEFRSTSGSLPQSSMRFSRPRLTSTSLD